MNNEWVKKYFAKELSIEKRNEWKQEMAYDPLEKESIEGMEQWLQENKQGSITALEKELNERTDIIIYQTKKENVFMNILKYATAACIIGIFSITSWRVFFVKKNVDEESIYASYFKPLTHPDATVRGENDNTEETKAIQAYEKENYFASVHYYENLVSEDSRNVKNNLFLGISLLATNQSQKSIDILKKITLSEEFHFDIQWYLALAYLKNKEIQNAKAILHTLTKDENYYKEEAGEILKKLSGKMNSNN